MGLNIGFGRSSYSSYDKPQKVVVVNQCKDKSQPRLPNPDPKNFEIIDVEKIGDFLIADVDYPDCTNYEGRKILVFRSVPEKDIRSWKRIDPHFSGSRPDKSPVARFVPTKWGVEAARKFCKVMSK